MEIGFNSIKNNGLQFGAAKDLHLGYIARKRASLLPQRVLNRVNAYVAFETGGTSKLPTLRQVHNDVYEALMNAKTLEEVKSASMYPEFMEVGNLAELPYRFSRSKKLIEKQMPLEDFALDCLKKIWSGKMVDDIASGNITPNPYTRGSSHNACRFCPYGSVCHAPTVEERRNYKMMSAQRFWEEVEKEMSKNE